MPSAAVVFVHGLLSSSAVWDGFRVALADDPAVTEDYDLLFFDYASPRISPRPMRRIPDLNTVADKLKGFLADPPLPYERLVIVTHSQGGLVVQRFLARMLNDGKGHELARIRGVVMFACPNNGSEFMLLLRRTFLPLLRGNKQELELRPISTAVLEAQRRVLSGIVHAQHLSADKCPIPLVAYAGEEDGIVTPASAMSVFPDAIVLPGDHSSIIGVEGGYRSVDALKGRLRKALAEPFPDVDSQSEVRDPSYGVPEWYISGIRAYEPVIVRLRPSGNPVPVTVHGGPIERVSGVDIIVSSENTYFEMSQSFKASTSARLRRAAAERSPSGVILWDLASDGLVAWMRENNCFGLRMNPGTVAPTEPGALRDRGIKRIYHAAVVDPRSGTPDYYVDPSAIAHAVHNVFTVARAERNRFASEPISICFPLFGAGKGGLDPELSFECIWKSIEEEIQDDPAWIVHFATWNPEEVSLIHTLLKQMTDHP
jgi:pimeloyl-ACP methyl ester carboxylesterase